MRVFLSLALTTLLLSGCAGTSSINQPYDYNPEHSRALNLAYSVGLDELEDIEVSAAQLSSGLSDALSLGLDTASFMDSKLLDFDFGSAFALGLLSSMSEPTAQIKRRTIIAWVPESELQKNGEETLEEAALRWVSDSLASATINAMSELDINYQVERQHRDFGLPFMFSDCKTRITASTAGGVECFARFNVREGSVSERLPLPAFLAVPGYGYKIYAGDDRRYPEGFARCWGEDGVDLNAELEILVSKNLPPTMFMYIPPANLEEEGVLPPYVLDHGKSFLFVTAKGN
jgi:hypothetical protein